MYNILFIDDEKSFLIMTKTALESFGFNVEIASNGKEGIRKFDKEHFKLVIMEYSNAWF